MKKQGQDPTRISTQVRCIFKKTYLPLADNPKVSKLKRKSNADIVTVGTRLSMPGHAATAM